MRTLRRDCQMSSGKTRSICNAFLLVEANRHKVKNCRYSGKHPAKTMKLMERRTALVLSTSKSGGRSRRRTRASRIDKARVCWMQDSNRLPKCHRDSFSDTKHIKNSKIRDHSPAHFILHRQLVRVRNYGPRRAAKLADRRNLTTNPEWHSRSRKRTRRRGASMRALQLISWQPIYWRSWLRARNR